MAIGTTAAIIGSAVVGVGASALSASKNSKAINQATEAQTASNAQAIAAQERARSENMGLQAPLYNAGLPAMNARNALLGLGGSTPQAASTPNALATYQGANPDTSGYRAGAQVGGQWDSYLAANPDVSREYYDDGDERSTFASPQAYAQWHYQNYGQKEGRALPTAAPAAPGGNTAQSSAQDAFANFRNSTGYQFRVDEGQNALNSGFAGSGVLQSGAALKGLDDYRQGMASAEFGNFWNMLGEQQNLTSGAANAMSGVNTTYANNAGNLAMQQGQNLSNAAIARANNGNALIGSIGSGIGNILGYYGGGR